MKTLINSSGAIYFGYNDLDGNPVECNPMTHRYSYDPYVTWRHPSIDHKQANGGVYSDRLRQYDYDKHEKLLKKHFGNQGQIWSSRDPKLIEAFLRDFNDDQSITLLYVLQGCNQSNGFPYWYFGYSYAK